MGRPAAADLWLSCQNWGPEVPNIAWWLFPAPASGTFDQERTKSTLCWKHWCCQQHGTKLVHVMRDRHQKAPYDFLPKGKTTVAQTYNTGTSKGRKFLRTVLICFRFRFCQAALWTHISHRWQKSWYSPTSENLDYSSLSLMWWLLLNCHQFLRLISQNFPNSLVNNWLSFLFLWK